MWRKLKVLITICIMHYGAFVPASYFRVQCFVDMAEWIKFGTCHGGQYSGGACAADLMLLSPQTFYQGGTVVAHHNVCDTQWS